MLTPRLPPEILDEIVNNVSTHRSTLCALSLSSSILLPSARHYLFSEVVLESSAICVFLKLLDVPWSTIAPAVRSVIISETAEGAYKGCKETRRKKGYYVPENPQRLRERMQGVHSITFSDISLADIPPPFWRLLNDLKGVKKLVVHQMSFDTPGTFFQYICSLPALETLSISKSSWEAEAAPPGQVATIGCKERFRAQGPFRIPLLDIGRHSQYDIMEWFLMQRPVPPVHTFRIHLDGCCATTAMIRQYIEEAGESVQQLHIDMPTSAMGIQRLSTIDFSPCTGLKGIHIEGLRVSSQQTQAHTLSAFMHTLFNSLRAPHLHEVSVSLTMDTGNDVFSFFGVPDHIALQSYTWGSLPEVLERTMGEQVKELRVQIRNYPIYQHEWSEGYLKKGPFASFGERGVLSVEFPDPPPMDAGFWAPAGFSSLMRFSNEGGLVNGNWGDD